MGVGIVADSAANLPNDVAHELGIVVVPMYLKFGDEVYRDGLDLTPTDFYQRLVRDGVVASTSTPSPGDYLEAYERTGAQDIVCVTVASSMSSSHQQASLAAERFEGHVEVVDSMTAAMAEGFVAVEAARAAARTASLPEIVARARDVSHRTRLYATVDSFEFLRKSGRVTKLQAYAATVLDIKPVFGFKEGEVVPVSRSRTKRKALARIVEDATREMGELPVHLAALHAAALGEAEEIAERISARANVVEKVITEVTPVIGAHTGPGLVGVAFFCER
ncbi:MAG TPA: DegV family protein [Actinomycetota bacterium]|nr:DegV family protein [Actinomycetota bacterium]